MKNKKPAGASTLKFGGRVSTSSGSSSSTPSGATAASSTGRGTDGKEEVDARKSPRWGVQPAAKPKGLGNPLEAVGSSVKSVGVGVTAAKDGLYGAVDLAGGLAELLLDKAKDGEGA